MVVVVVVVVVEVAVMIVTITSSKTSITATLHSGKISESLPLSSWSDMLPSLLSLLDTFTPLLRHLNSTSAAPEASLLPHLCGLDGAIQAIKRVCEDSPLKLAHDSDPSRSHPFHFSHIFLCYILERVVYCSLYESSLLLLPDIYWEAPVPSPRVGENMEF